MSIQLNHTIVWCRDKQKASAFLVELFRLREPSRFGPFLVVQVDNGVSLDYSDDFYTDRPIEPQHYAFLVGDTEFDAIFGRIRSQGLAYWADPGKQRSGEINHHDGGRGVYFTDPDGHLFEIITRPYGSGGPA